ncbi:MAG TPA: zinc ribbon domain-containing protein [Thermoplasmata archaeon]|nr:zinc ribbon domain-containing protein [Thermoplasmata archaeon]
MHPLVRPLVFVALLGTLVAVGLGLQASAAGFAHGAPAAPTPTAGPQLAVHPAATHGDLIVGPSNSPFVISPSTIQGNVYSQGGNVSVLPGGTLIVRNVTFSFVQFVGTSGTIGSRLSHVYWFWDRGTVSFTGSLLTTNLAVLNAFPKVNLNVTNGGKLSLTNSVFGFAGSVSVSGGGSTLRMNGSAFTQNPQLVGLPYIENQTILHDSIYAPALSVTGGAHAILERSQLLSAYRDNWTRFGYPAPSEMDNSNAQSVSSSAGAVWGHLALPADPENLTRSDLYATIQGGSIVLDYTSTVTTSASVTLVFGSQSFTVGTATFTASGSQASVALNAAAVAAIDAAGWNAFLSATGDFGGTSGVNISVGTTGSATPLTISDAGLVVQPSTTNNLTVSGSGTVFTAADSLLDLNFNLTPGSPYYASTTAPTPWGSNKLILTNGAEAFLANLSVTSGRSSVYWNQSAVLPDASSQAVFYRWAVVPIFATPGVPIPGALATAFYAYDNSQTNNNTVTAFNNLATANPDLWAYVASVDQLDHVAAYGLSNLAGHASLLLTSTVLTQGALPDGQYLGGYHIAVKVSALQANSTQWVYGTVTPYPIGLTPGQADFTIPLNYPSYRAELSVGAVTVSTAGVVASGTAQIGSRMTVAATITNSGTATVATYFANLSYQLPAPFHPKSVAPDQPFVNLAPGASQAVNLSWVVNESVTGDHGKFVGTFLVTTAWNGGVGPAAGVVSVPVPVTILPSPVTVALVLPPGQFHLGTSYFTSGSVSFAGSGQAIVNVTASGPGGSYFLNGVLQPNGSASVGISPITAMSPGTYTLQVTAFYNGRTGFQNFTNAYVVPGSATSSSPFSFLTTAFFGFPLWELLAFAAVGVVAIVAAFAVLGRAARGKLVECGECGELIPETATACPKCGAEFEADLVRCSRCSSTIPATAKVCPECSATLLGKGEGGAADPEQQGYADWVERYRIEARKELGDNYGEGAFWDWWKRQPTYVSFSQWRLQQGQGTSRAGMGAPPPGAVAPDDAMSQRTYPAPAAAAPAPRRPAQSVPPPAARPAAPVAPPRAAAPPPSAPAPSVASATPVGPPAASPGMKACGNCGREIPPDYLVCPFCGAVTR